MSAAEDVIGLWLTFCLLGGEGKQQAQGLDDVGGKTWSRKDICLAEHNVGAHRVLAACGGYCEQEC